MHSGELFFYVAMVYDLMIVGQRGYLVLPDTVHVQLDVLSWIDIQMH